MTSAIYRNVFRLLLPLLWLLSLCGCTGDMLQDEVVAPSVGGELPVEFEFVLASTRADDDADDTTTPTDYTLIADRKSFKDKDVIHIEGRFTVVEQNGDESEEIRYGAMSYDSKKGWTAVAESELTWPDKAVKGEFTAYYIDISKNNTDGGVLTKGGSTSTYNLTDLTSDTDPLKAVGEADSYGHAVKMQFKHLCTYLELRGLGAAVADTYWFTRKNGETNLLKNSFKLTRNDDNTLEFEFVATEDSWYKGLVYIATKPADGTAAFFLPPGRYGSFTLCYSAVESNYYEYLEYTYVPSEDGPAESPELYAGHSYLLDISKSKGITINTPPQGPEEETWDDSDDYIEVDVREFLEAVAKGDDYYCNNAEGESTQILQKGNGQTKLLHNISFNYNKYEFFTNDANDFFEPIVSNVFDGGLHYIKDIARPVFHRNNQGTIRNLGLRNIDAEFISDEAQEYGSDENAKDAHDMSRNGILCGWNYEGTISNIRIAGAKITAKVKNDTDTEDDRDASQETHNIGCVVGSNTGTITDLALAGTFTLTVEGYVGEGYTKQVDATVIIGGIAGQNAENATITNVGSYEDTELNSSLKSISITNNCSGEAGAFYVGGVVGLSSGYISWVTLPDVTIDGSQSSCVAMYMGGVAGQLSDTSSGSAVATTSCTVTGSVKAGTVKNTDKSDVTPKSYIGGVAGVLEQSITVCRTAVSVHVDTKANTGVTYATGGAFGRILKTADDISIENIMAYGDALTGPNQYIGNFVGIAPEGKTWEGDYKDHDIVVKEYTGYDNIGGNNDKEQ